MKQAIILWPLRYGARGLATATESPIAVLLIPSGGLLWELCTATLTGADNDR